MSYNVLLSDDVRDYIAALDEKSERIVKDNLGSLVEHPHPGRGKGDKEKLVVDGEEMFRQHIGRTHTAFYVIVEDADEVRVVDLMPVDEVHDRYRY